MRKVGNFTRHSARRFVISISAFIAISAVGLATGISNAQSNGGNVDWALKGGSYVTSTPALEHATLEDFLHGDEKVSEAEPKPGPPEMENGWPASPSRYFSSE